MRYVIALLAAAVIIAAIGAYGYSLHHSIIAELRTEVQQLPDKDKLPEGYLNQLEQGRLPDDFGGMVSSSVMWKFQVLSLLVDFWYLIGIFIIGVSLLIARSLSRETVSHSSK